MQMKKISVFSLSLMAAFSFLVSCGKGSPVSSGEKVVFAVGDQTKGLLNNSDFSTDGTMVRVFDIITGAESYSPENNRHINDVLQYVSVSDSWTTILNPFYLWPATGSQRFFGFLWHDAKSNLDVKDLFGEVDLSESDNKTLRLPAAGTVAMNPSSKQFDFAYSNTVARTGDADKSPVMLHLEHLFTSFSFSATNTSDHDVTIKSLTFYNFKNTGSASVSFESAGTQVNYGATSVSGSSWNWTGNLAVNRNETINNITAETPGGDPDYKLMWPQRASDFTSIDYDEESTTYTPHDPNLCYIGITFSQGEGDITRLLGFPLKDWNAGKRYLFTVEFANKLIQISSTVLPWTLEEMSVDYDSGTIQANSIIRWQSKDIYMFYDPARLVDDGHGGLTIDDSKGQSIVNDDEKTVYVKNGMPVKVRFNLNTPKGAEWLISLSGDYQAFKIEKLAEHTIDGSNCDFQLVPKTTGEYASPSRDYKVNIRIVLRLPNGRIVSADPVLQGPESEGVLENQYTIILPKV